MSAAPQAAEVDITLPDGSVRTYGAGVTGFEIAESIARSLAKKALAVVVDGEVRDLSWPIAGDAAVKIVTRGDDEALELIRHDCAHVMAEAVQALFPGTQVTIGPAIETGFYYDFAREEPFSPDDLEKIEQKMREIIARDAPFTREVWDRNAAIAHFRQIGEHYKAELIEDLPEDEEISLYSQGEWHDLCRGPHLPSTGKIGTAFKLMKLAGAYWRGDHRNPMLQRIYGTAWRDETELAAHLTMLEEAEKRDHRRLGREMGLYHFQEEAQGSVFWHPRGFVIWNALEQYIRRRIHADGYVEVKTPQLIDNRLWEASGHWGKFRENMFVVPDEIPNTDDDGPILTGEGRLMAIKPMNCPAHVQIFNQGVKSYRDLPLRMAEMGCCHRNEAHGALHGLMRVRQMTQDDAHIFCTEDQVKDEVQRFMALFYRVYADFGFTDIAVRLATRPAVRAGADAVWDKAEAAMAAALEDLAIAFDWAPGEGAFYGPKYEFHLKDAIGRSWQMGTCQLDFVLPERLDASYVGADGNRHRPVMIHRAVFGSFERFIGVLIESTAGKLPLWLAPVQVAITTIVSDADAYALEVGEALKAAGIRTETDLRNEKITYKVREHSLAKVPLIAVVGKREAEERTVALRRLGSRDQEMLGLDALVAQVASEAAPPG